jgi:uncharacterized membrane protein (DUF2068 family)
MKSSDGTLIRLIALFKLLKTILFIAVGIGAFKLLYGDAAAMLERWVTALGLDPGNQFIERALNKAAGLTPNKIKGLGVGSFIYAALFLTEGIGLWLLERWAEWLTVIITSSLIPVEIYEIHRHATAIKVAVLFINVAIAAYLIYRLRRDRVRLNGG